MEHLLEKRRERNRERRGGVTDRPVGIGEEARVFHLVGSEVGDGVSEAVVVQ
jgi:hypothetical protein